MRPEKQIQRQFFRLIRCVGMAFCVPHESKRNIVNTKTAFDLKDKVRVNETIYFDTDGELIPFNEIDAFEEDFVTIPEGTQGSIVSERPDEYGYMVLFDNMIEDSAGYMVDSISIDEHYLEKI